MKNKAVLFTDWGLVDYIVSHQKQEDLFNSIIEKKLQNRKSETNSPTKNHLIFCEHPHSYTLGRSGKESNLLFNEQFLESKGARFYKIKRGGDITYHGPGQIVGYPILDLDNFFTDIHKYLRFLEEAIIKTCADYNLTAGRVEGLTGVWIDPESDTPRKICAMGVKASRWVTMHGFAFNVNTNLDYFNYIVPCGISDKAVTSLQKELGKEIDTTEVKKKVLQHLTTLFEFNIVTE